MNITWVKGLTRLGQCLGEAVVIAHRHRVIAHRHRVIAHRHRVIAHRHRQRPLFGEGSYKIDTMPW